jgi:hypothetical protein
LVSPVLRISDVKIEVRGFAAFGLQVSRVLSSRIARKLSRLAGVSEAGACWRNPEHALRRI